jgi:hypothetical protein
MAPLFWVYGEAKHHDGKVLHSKAAHLMAAMRGQEKEGEGEGKWETSGRKEERRESQREWGQNIPFNFF